MNEKDSMLERITARLENLYQISRFIQKNRVNIKELYIKKQYKAVDIDGRFKAADIDGSLRKEFNEYLEKEMIELEEGIKALQELILLMFDVDLLAFELDLRKEGYLDESKDPNIFKEVTKILDENTEKINKILKEYRIDYEEGLPKDEKEAFGEFVEYIQNIDTVTYYIAKKVRESV